MFEIMCTYCIKSTYHNEFPIIKKIFVLIKVFDGFFSSSLHTYKINRLKLN